MSPPPMPPAPMPGEVDPLARGGETRPAEHVARDEGETDRQRLPAMNFRRDELTAAAATLLPLIFIAASKKIARMEVPK